MVISVMYLACNKAAFGDTAQHHQPQFFSTRHTACAVSLLHPAAQGLTQGAFIDDRTVDVLSLTGLERIDSSIPVQQLVELVT